MRVFYLPGFASSPTSSKAQFFAERLAAHGVSTHSPDFNAPDFATLTASRMIAQTEAMLCEFPGDPAVLTGSSLGGFVAWHVAARAAAGASNVPREQIERLVLLAPAFDFGANRLKELGETGLARWRETGWHTFFHYAYEEPRAVHYALYEDAQRYRSDLARVHVPVLAFQGTRDEAVDPDMVVRFAAARPNVLLRLVDDEHQLRAHLEPMWTEMAAFIGLRWR